MSFTKFWFSHKFKGLGLHYEVGLSIRMGMIVWRMARRNCNPLVFTELAKRLSLTVLYSITVLRLEKGS